MNAFFVKYRFVITLIFVWLLFLSGVYYVTPYFFPERIGYIGPTPFANFDGIHYLRIAREGYGQYLEAFFPLYPMVVGVIGKYISIPPYLIGMSVSCISFVVGLFFLYSFVLKEKDKKTAKFTILMLVSFPTSFFFVCVYTEGLFFLLSVLTVIYTRNRKWLFAGLFGLLAGATRLVGVILVVYMCIEYLQTYGKKLVFRPLLGIALVPLGLLGFMWYLSVRTGDPLAFMHVQSAFGAQRSNLPVILLPQVLWRYAKIIFTAYMQPTPISYIVTIAELCVTVFAFSILWFCRKSISLGLTVFSFLVLLVPTMTGTFSSMTRYVLSAFPLFISLGTMHNTKLKTGIVVVFLFLQLLSAGLFFRGWFIG